MAIGVPRLPWPGRGTSRRCLPVGADPLSHPAPPPSASCSTRPIPVTGQADDRIDPQARGQPRGQHEADLSAQQATPGEAPRLSPSDVIARWTCGRALPPSAGPGPAFGLIAPLRDQRAFAALRRYGHRARSGPLSVMHHPCPDRDDLRVAYAIGRPVGTAVTRNRLRRQLRSALTELERDDATPSNGDLVVAARPDATGLDYQSLRRHLRVSLSSLPDGSRT